MKRRADICVETQKKLGKLMLVTAESEEQLELSRQRLCKTKQFEPYASYQRIDRGGKGYISIKDLQNFMK
jgi:hypothetical protein